MSTFNFSLNKGKVLVILSGSDFIQLKSGKQKETGFFLVELMKPVKKLLEAGFSVEFANTNGTAPHMDPLSNKYIWFNFNVWEYNAEIKLLDWLKQNTNFNSPFAFREVTEGMIESYMGIFIPGGHAPMQDLRENAELGRIITQFHNLNKPIASLCHGPIALLSTMSSQGDFLFKGYKITGYSNAEEKVNELMWRDTVEHKLEDELRAAGADYAATIPMLPKVTEDRELITGQGPSSAGWLGDSFVKALQKQISGAHA